MPNNQFFKNLDENRKVADQLFRDLEKQFWLMRRMWKDTDPRTLLDQLEHARRQIEAIEELIGSHLGGKEEKSEGEGH